MTTDTDQQAVDRFFKGVEIILDSGLLDASQCDAFWAFLDGDLDEDAARERIR